MNTPLTFKLYDYILFENGKYTGKITKLGLHEAQKINFAYGLNRANKKYILKSEVSSFKDCNKSIVITPEKN